MQFCSVLQGLIRRYFDIDLNTAEIVTRLLPVAHHHRIPKNLMMLHHAYAVTKIERFRYLSVFLCCMLRFMLHPAPAFRYKSTRLHGHQLFVSFGPNPNCPPMMQAICDLSQKNKEPDTTILFVFRKARRRPADGQQRCASKQVASTGIVLIQDSL